MCTSSLFEWVYNISCNSCLFSYYGGAQLVDIFQFSNVYATHRDIAQLLVSQEMQLECQQFVSKQDQKPSLGILCSLYCAFKGGMKVSEWFYENPLWTAQIDMRRFIVFGVLKGVIYRVHKYPILYKEVGMNSEIAKLLDGRHHLDDLCSRLACSAKQLENILSSLPIRYVLK